jgi:hypothetical protein
MAWRRGRGLEEEQDEQKEQEELTEQKEQKEQKMQEELATATVPHAGRTAEGNGEWREESTVVCVVFKEARSQENTAKNSQASRAKEHWKAKTRGDDDEEEARKHGAIRHGKSRSDSQQPAWSPSQKQS